MVVRLRFSQPNGVVMITSSKNNFSFAAVVTITDGFSDVEVIVEIDVTLVERCRSASARAALATWARIALYVPATKRFSSPCQKCGSEWGQIGKHAFVKAFLQPKVL